VSPVISGYGASPQGTPVEVAGLILETTDAPWLPSDVATSMAGWLEGTPRPLSETAALVLDGARDGAVVVATVPGPLTLAMAARAAAHPAYRTHLAIDALVSWIERRMFDVAAVRDDVALRVVLDEPAMSAFAPDAVDAERFREVAVNALATIVARSPAPLVIRTSDDTDWSVIVDAGPAFIGWNVTDLGFGFEQHVDAVAEGLGSGMGVMWGVASVEPTPQSSDDVALTRYRTALARLVVAGAPLRAIRDDAWFVPNGSLERLGVDNARRVMRQVAGIAEEAHD
jgi:hypothetical protein